MLHKVLECTGILLAIITQSRSKGQLTLLVSNKSIRKKNK
jgi:hypothetical protein